MQNKLPQKNQNTGKNGPTTTPIPATHLQNKSNFPQNSGKMVDSRREKGPEDGQQ